jgi:hypothetical protein
MPTFLLLEGREVKKAVRGADAKGIRDLIEYARKKVEGLEVGVAEEEKWSQTDFAGASTG